MRIAFVNQPLDPALPPRQGSLAIWTSQVARRLAPTHAVRVYGTFSRRNPRVGRVDGVDYRLFRSVPHAAFLRLAAVVAGVRRSPLPLFASRLYHPEYILQIARDLRRDPVDVVHINNFAQFVPVLRALVPGIRIVLHMQCQWLSRLDRAAMLARVAPAELIIGCSDFVTEEIRRAFPSIAARCHTVYNGVDPNHFAPNGDRSDRDARAVQRILCVGRVSPEKGLHVLVDAFAQVSSACPNTELSIVGPTPPLPLELLAALSRDPRISALTRFYPGDYVAQLTRRVPPDVAARVSFVGPVAHRDTVRYYRAADVYVMPSLSEAFGMAAVEAMAVGLPVVASRVEGIPETVCHEETGLLVAPDDAGTLAQALLRLLGDDQLRRAMGEAGRRRAVQRFSWERIVQTLGDHYQSLGGGDARHRR